MGKSVHPPLLKKALADVARVDKVVKKDAAALKAIAKSCAAAQKSASSAATDFDSQLKYLKEVIENYGKKVLEIEQIESDLADARGDKKKETELKRKLSKADKEADGLRKEYERAGKVFGTLAHLVADELARLNEAGQKVVAGWG